MVSSREESKYRRILSRYLNDSQRLAHGAWMLTSDHELTAMFNANGFEWLFLFVSQSSDGRFSGGAEARTDTFALERKGSVLLWPCCVLGEWIRAVFL
jgi:hypothetical protein